MSLWSFKILLCGKVEEQKATQGTDLIIILVQICLLIISNYVFS